MGPLVQWRPVNPPFSRLVAGACRCRKNRKNKEKQGKTKGRRKGRRKGRSLLTRFLTTPKAAIRTCQKCPKCEVSIAALLLVSHQVSCPATPRKFGRAIVADAQSCWTISPIIYGVRIRMSCINLESKHPPCPRDKGIHYYQNKAKKDARHLLAQPSFRSHA